MVNIFLDPFIFACPTADQDADKLDRYIKSILFCENPHGLFLSANPITVWAACQRETDYHKSLCISIYQVICKSASSPLDSRDLFWAFGHNFIRTAKDFGFLHQEDKIRMLIRACAETILGHAMSDVHHLREGKGGNSPQRKYGSYKAWRRDIDYEFHLHYWEAPDGRPIFADIVVHNNMSITSPPEDIEFISIRNHLPSQG